jgi:hypothetical protein
MKLKLGLTLREEHRMSFENRVLWRLFGMKKQEVPGWRKLRSFITCTLHQISLW